MRLIDADKLYKRTAEWEAQAQDEVNRNKGCRTVEEWDEDRKWLIILNERSSFKYDVADAPTIEAEPIKHGRWIKNEDRSGWHCSCCGKDDLYAYPYTENNERELQDFYCPNCGAKMDV